MFKLPPHKLNVGTTYEFHVDVTDSTGFSSFATQVILHEKSVGPFNTLVFKTCQHPPLILARMRHVGYSSSHRNAINRMPHELGQRGQMKAAEQGSGKG